VARRYARALLEVAGPEKAAGLREELAGWSDLLRDHPEIEAALRHPALPGEKKKALLAALGRSTQTSDLLQRLLALLLENDRLDLLTDIASAYVTLWNAQRGAVAAEMVSAVPLEAAQREAVRAAAARAAGGREVELQALLDPDLLGGVLLRMEGRTYDGSVRGRLHALRQMLRAGAAASAGRD
jgi:F-type H+-transporting ATPase subunit delta